MATFTQLCSGLSYHILHINLLALEDTCFDSWIGASIRNNFLYAARETILENGKDLFSIINEIPLAEEHPLYKSVSGGATRGYLITPTSFAKLSAPFCIKKHERLTFSLVLVGAFSEYYPAFIKAIQGMCKRGFGKPMHPFLFLDVYEEAADKKQTVLFSSTMDAIQPLGAGRVWEDSIISAPRTIGIRYTSPTSLFSRRNKKDNSISYQDKLNCFPGFYQLTRSVCFRLAKLYALYYKPEDEEVYTTLVDSIDPYLEEATRASLLSVNLQKTLQMSTLKKESSNRIKLPGYVGEMYFEGNFNTYSNLLWFAQNLGVGKDSTYGLGKYEVIE